jgi:hypothetical protein
MANNVSQTEKSVFAQNKVLTPNFSTIGSGDSENIYFGSMTEDESGEINGFALFSINRDPKGKVISMPIREIESDFKDSVYLFSDGTKSFYLTKEGNLKSV